MHRMALDRSLRSALILATTAFNGTAEASATPLPAPHIIISNFSGSPDVTGKTVSVYLGQKIALITSPGAVAGQTQSWVFSNVPTIPIGGFDSTGNTCPVSPAMATKPCDVVYPIVTNKTNMTLHFVKSGTYGLSYSYQYKSQIVRSNVTFRVLGPKFSIPAPQLGKVQIVNIGGQPRLSFGDTKTPGIKISAKSSDSSNGVFYWTQIVNGDVLTLVHNGTNISCPETYGLDGRFVYAHGLVSTDTPSVEISDDSLAIRDIQLTTYLLWQYNQDGAIPVPLASVTWGAEMQAFAPAGAQGWSVTSSVQPVVIDDNLFIYPYWFSIDQGGSLTCKDSGIIK